MKTLLRFLLPLVLSLSLVSGTFLHALIPHDHGSGALKDGVYTHAHSTTHNGGPIEGTEEESSSWVSLHGALHHEDKKVWAAVLPLLLFLFFFASRATALSAVVSKYVLSCGQLIAAILSFFILLSNGKVAYRRFD